MTSEMSIAKGNASLSHLEELAQGNIRVEKFMRDAKNHKRKNNQPISILASCLVVVK
jgi:hypothetical protein